MFIQQRSPNVAKKDSETLNNAAGKTMKAKAAKLSRRSHEDEEGYMTTAPDEGAMIEAMKDNATDPHQNQSQLLRERGRPRSIRSRSRRPRFRSRQDEAERREIHAEAKVQR